MIRRILTGIALKMKDAILIYHRFLPEDYEEFGFGK